MIGVVGTQDDCIGFGLTGIAHRREVAKSATTQEVLQAVKDLATQVDTIIIAEQLHNKIRDHELPDVFFIDIPSEDAESTTAYIETLTKELLGITL